MNDSSRFLTLPCEVRDQIYTYVCGNQVIDIACCPTSGRRSLTAEREQGMQVQNIKNMLLVCRQMTQEAAHIFYSTNQFCFEDHDVPQMFDTVVPPQFLTSIRNIKLTTKVIYLYEETLSSWFTTSSLVMFGRMPNLVYIHLRLERSRHICTHGCAESRVILQDYLNTSMAFPKLKRATVEIFGCCRYIDLYGPSERSEFRQWTAHALEAGLDFLAGLPVKRWKGPYPEVSEADE